MLVNRDSNNHPRWSHGGLAESLDVALTACIITFSLPDFQVQKLYTASIADGSYAWKDRLRFLWVEDMMRSI